MKKKEQKKWILENWKSLSKRKKLSKALRKYWELDIDLIDKAKKIFNGK